jgi:tetratricopeptide (TPR) repeat protein
MPTMKNITSHCIHQRFPSLLLAALIAFSACTDPETARQKQIEAALTLQASGQNEAAIKILQTLLEAKPEDPDLLQHIGEIHQSANDLTLAALFLEQAALADPQNNERCLQAYLALKAADEATLPTLRTLALQAPELMTPEMWLELGAQLALANQAQPALDAYLKGIPKDPAAIGSQTASAIGSLFLELNNQALAERWFKIAAQDSGPEALTALLGLLEIKLSAAEWSAAEALIQQLDQRFPGAVDASDWATARRELKVWHEAQEEMSETLKQNAQVATEPAETPAPVAESNPASSGKSIAATEFDAMEALANQPAIEATETTENEVQYDPAITIQPADPDLNNDAQGPAANPETNPEVTTETDRPSDPETTTPPETSPPSLETLLADAENATLQRDFKGAVRLYWQALGQDNTNPQTWSALSKAYTLSGETRNAETTALEAVRLAPTEVEFTLDYLRIAQRSKTPRSFLAELEIAFDRFPRNPEITLSLARALQRISNDRPAAAALYQQFINRFPRHPLRPEADAALVTLAQPAP